MPGQALSCLLNKDGIMGPFLQEHGEVQFLEDMMWSYLVSKVKEVTIATYAPTFVTVKSEFHKMMSIKAKVISCFKLSYISHQKPPRNLQCLAEIERFR
jgi:hypothetical protein